MFEHFHISRYSDDAEPAVTADIRVALYVIAEHLDTIAGQQEESIIELGAAHEYESAYWAHQNANAYGVMAQNARNLRNNAAVDTADRAPLFREERQYGPKWMQSLDHFLSTVEMDGPEGLTLTRCDKAECAPGVIVSTVEGRDTEWSPATWEGSVAEEFVTSAAARVRKRISEMSAQFPTVEVTVRRIDARGDSLYDALFVTYDPDTDTDSE